MLVTVGKASVLALCAALGWGISVAFAADECGAGGTVTCTSAGNNYTSGINYSNANQSVTIQSGVVVNSGAHIGIDLTGTGTQTLTLVSGVTVTTNGSFDGVSILNATGLISISAAGTTVSAGTANGFNLQTSGAIGATVGDVTGTVAAIATGTGNVSVTTGSVSTTADNATAVFAQGAGGTVTVDTTGGSISTVGAAANGVVATFNGSSGAATITTGDVTTHGDLANGVAGFVKGPNTALTIDTTAGTIATFGNNAPGIDAQAGNFPLTAANAGLLTIRTGGVATHGASPGIVANAFGGDMDITIGGAITTVNGDGIDTSSANLAGVSTVTIKVNGSISAGGDFSNGILAIGAFGFKNAITVNGPVAATGASGVGIISGGDSGDQITVNVGGSVSGNTGIEFFDFTSATTTVTNNGTITGTGGTAVTFLGIAPDVFTNNGAVSGSVLLGDGADTAILNTGSSISGTLDGGAGTDTLKLGGAGTATLDLSNVKNFEIADKIDSGTWTLTGTGTISTSTTVSAGTLSVNGQLTSPTVTVDPVATLQGTGTIIGAVTVNGTVAPGNSIGTLHVSGSYAQGAGSIYQVELNPTTSDLIAVTGSATVDGTASVRVTAAAGSYTVGHQYIILSATGGVTGQFGNLTDNLPFVDFALGADADDIFLDVIASGVPLDQIARTPNEKAAARGLESLGAGHAPVDAVMLLTAPDARHAFDLLSGEIHPSVVSVLLYDSGDVRDAMLGRLRQSVGGAAAIFAPTLATLEYGRPTRVADAGDPPLAQRGDAQADGGLTGWARPFGGFGHFEGDDNAASLNRSTSGIVAGIDATLVSSGVWRFGIAAGYQGSALGVGDRGSSANVGTYHIAAYAGTQQGALGLRVGGAYSGHSINTNRAVVFPGFAETERATYGGATAQGFGEAGYTVVLGQVAFEPFAGVAYVDVRLDPFTESGGTAALHSPGGGTDTVFSSLGLRAALPLPWRGVAGNLILKGSAAWQHAFGALVPSTSLAFTSSSPFLIAGLPIAAEEAKIELGLDTALAQNATLGIAYRGQIAGNAQDHQFSANLAVRF